MCRYRLLVRSPTQRRTTQGSLTQNGTQGGPAEPTQRVTGIDYVLLENELTELRIRAGGLVVEVGKTDTEGHVIGVGAV